MARKPHTSPPFRRHSPSSGDSPSGKPRLGVRQAWARRRERWEAFSARRPLLSCVPFLAISGLVLTGVILSSSCTLCYRASSDRGTVAIFHGADTYQAAVSKTEEKVSHILSTDYKFDENLSVSPTLAKKDEVQNLPAVTDALLNTVPELEHVYTLTVDGTRVGACENIADLNNALDQVKQIYVTPDTTSVEYASDITLNHEYLPSSVGTTSTDSVVNALTAATTKTFPYTVQEGDTAQSVASAFGMTRERLNDLNPDLDLTPGQSVNVEQLGPLLTVTTVEQVSSSRTIDPETQTVADDTMYTGNQRIIQPGTPGEETVTTQVTCRSGQPLYRSEVNSVTVTEAIPLILAEGTKALPGLPENGLFLWPVSGTITSNFGYRFIFGEDNFHRGVDLACPFGTPIQAADDGTVTFAGERGTYGNLVIVDHHNGFVTYYGHCSSFLVQAGDTVTRGQAIALVGSTGRSTGNHCHFEVHYQGNLVNPLQYLPGPDGKAVITDTPVLIPESALSTGSTTKTDAEAADHETDKTDQTDKTGKTDKTDGTSAAGSFKTDEEKTPSSGQDSGTTPETGPDSGQTATPDPGTSDQTSDSTAESGSSRETAPAATSKVPSPDASTAASDEAVS